MPATQEIYQVKLRDIADEPTSLAAHSGKVLLLVNVASECGFTSHYEGTRVDSSALYRFPDAFTPVGFVADSSLSDCIRAFACVWASFILG